HRGRLPSLRGLPRAHPKLRKPRSTNCFSPAAPGHEPKKPNRFSGCDRCRNHSFIPAIPGCRVVLKVRLPGRENPWSSRRFPNRATGNNLPGHSPSREQCGFLLHEVAELTLGLEIRIAGKRSALPLAGSNVPGRSEPFLPQALRLPGRVLIFES